MTDNAAKTITREKEDINMKLVNQGRYVFVGTIKHGDDIMAVIADKTSCSESRIDSARQAIQSYNRVAFNNAAAVATNVEGGGIMYQNAEALKTRKETLQGADRETYKRAIKCVGDKKEALAAAALPAATRRLTAMSVP